VPENDKSHPASIEQNNLHSVDASSAFDATKLATFVKATDGPLTTNDLSLRRLMIHGATHQSPLDHRGRWWIRTSWHSSDKCIPDDQEV